MTSRLGRAATGAAFALVLAAAGAAPAAAAGDTRAASHDAPVTFAATVALSNCSGSVVRTPQSRPDDPALVLSNGHCIESGFPQAGEVIVDQPSTRTFTLLDEKAGDLGTLRADRISYATMTDTDVSLYRLTTSYRQIERQYHVRPLLLDARHPRKNTAITVVSGYWKQQYRCAVDGFVNEVREYWWTWKDSVRYTPGCGTIGGTSGSPVIDDRTGRVVAVNNTHNEDGEQCTLNNPCEVDRKGRVTVRPDARYAQETYGIVPCVRHDGTLDLGRKKCTLPEPQA
ncbi:serine protease [Streptomyces sp. SID5785]|uniref:S1 family peptidase n=1 Tax=Streptomyces sp. SID5785 TaxID=2690309 RepID=UPI001361DD62|nr:serine protease [Streptomyces sp. SID5785]MZD04769.1 serine protease [Streptomyces sp. SID5785]